MYRRFHHRRPLSAYLSIAAAALALAGMTVSCKPTEKNYRAAYDTAMIKRQAEEEARRQLEKDLDIVGEGLLEEVDGTRREVLKGDTVWTLHMRFALRDSILPYSLAVARLSMRANALAMTEQHPGWKAASSGDNYYILAAQSNSLDSILHARRAFLRSNPGFHAIGLTDVTVIVQ